MATKRGVRIVSDGTVRGTDVIDLETGAKLLRVYSVEISADARTGRLHTRIVSSDSFEYEGPAEIVTPEETVENKLAEKVATKVVQAMQQQLERERHTLRMKP